MMDEIGEKKSLIFLHIPKSAGSTLHNILERNYDPERTYTIDGLRTNQSIQEFKELSTRRRSSIDLLKGHMVFGLHKYIPSPCTYITFLRDPVERVISYYFYVRRFPEHYLHKKVVESNMSLQDFVESRMTTELFDFQVKMIAGVESALHSWDYDKALLKLAQDNIDKYFLTVGFAEYFDQSLLLIKKKLGGSFWPYYKKLNVTKGRAKIDTIDENVIQLIRVNNSLDCALYDWALVRFNRELCAAKITNFNVVLFRLLNGLYSMVR